MASDPEINQLKEIVNTEPEDKLFGSFIESVNLDIKRINQLIDDYNQNQNDEDTRNKLVDDINRYRLEMNNKYNLRYIAKCQSYCEQMHKTLYNDIQKQLKTRSLPSEPQNTEPLTKLIVDMSGDDLSMFIKVLWKNNVRQTIRSLMTIEGVETFFRTHDLGFMTQGMWGNSRNIKITNRNNTQLPPCVLKIDSRLCQPSSAEMVLRKHGVKYLTKIYGETRQGIFVAQDGKKMAANVVVTDFYEKGDLENEARIKPQMTPAAKQARGCHLYLKMANIMQDMLAKNVAFPDAKNSNWLISANDELILADTKSFAHVNESGELDYLDEKNKWIVLITTCSHFPIEFEDRTRPFSVDKMNAYMLGKNLYQYLTGFDNQILKQINDPSQLEFNNIVFNDEKGKMFTFLIQKLLEVDPQNRPSLKIAMSALEEINKVSQNKTNISFACFKIKFECLEKLDKIKSLAPSTKEDNQIYNAVIKKVQSSSDLSVLNALNDTLGIIISDTIELNGIEMEKILEITEEVSKTIKHFQSTRFFYKDADRKKAEEIQTTFKAIPLKDRAHIFDADNAQNKLVIAFKKALASHRLGSTEEKNKACFNVDTNQIDSEKAAATYKKFKEKFEVIKKNKACEGHDNDEQSVEYGTRNNNQE